MVSQVLSQQLWGGSRKEDDQEFKTTLGLQETSSQKANKKYKFNSAMCPYYKSSEFNKWNKDTGKGDDALQGIVLTRQSITDNKKDSINKI